MAAINGVELWKLALLSLTTIGDVKNCTILALNSEPASKDLVVFILEHVSKNFSPSDCIDIIRIITEHIEEIGINQFISVDELKLMFGQV
ncbi:hypothetical protein DI09_179p10 [Mitosporidium daphniae]|uniref:Uncharacterized protein n=1 Tax=Mitosporidium daphniae TaxID=1485682 RepID=A0A098VTX7_9MICR|nr:uncharacterized protein DI09_179p10 [Mitosporidium daphniae]KGG52402.1 hypothetical protein DI09_179p10 [Mitosporidium daphniae]|eukprot:XP_013238838.1 uncharacterized protein DI09_179p10 [Mitosporidium daphniae]